MDSVLRIARPERRRLLMRGRKEDAGTCERLQIVVLLGGGKTVTEVARLLGVAIAHVARTRARCLREGADGLRDQRRFNGACAAGEVPGT